MAQLRQKLILVTCIMAVFIMFAVCTIRAGLGTNFVPENLDWSGHDGKISSILLGQSNPARTTRFPPGQSSTAWATGKFLVSRRANLAQYTITNHNNKSLDLILSRAIASYNSKGYLVDTAGCKIPDYNPFDASVLKLYKKVRPLVCAGPPSSVIFNQTHITIDKKGIEQRLNGSFECFHTSIRKKDEESDDTYKFGKSTMFDGTVRVEEEFLKIECTPSLKKQNFTYIEFLPFIQIKPDVEKRCDEKFEKWSQETKNVILERLSVTFVGIDSVSRLNMIRQMPNTYSFLKNNKNTIELQGFVKLGDNTFVNVVPLLTGLYAEECWNETMKVPFDYLNLIWKNFSDKGYRTLYAEDYPFISAFNHLKCGFYKQPTDYYMRPFHLAVEDSYVNKVEANCHNNRPEVNVTLQWLVDFLTTFKTKPTFAFLYNSRMTHDSLNDAGRVDQLYLDFLHEYSKNLLDSNSILVTFSDHGIRFGKIRFTYIGKVEERMPFVFLTFPPWFQKKYPKMWANLRVNQNRLTTFFDLHETLKQILNFTGEAVKADVYNRGISLFSEIPPERTCENAGISAHWCTCHEKKSVPLTDAKVVAAAQLIVTEINKELSSQDKHCAHLSLNKIKAAQVSRLSDKILLFQKRLKDIVDHKIIHDHRLPNVWEFLVTVSVKPSGAVLEGTVKYFEATHKYVLIGDVSRINKYGNQSQCVTSPHLKKFCYCI